MFAFTLAVMLACLPSCGPGAAADPAATTPAAGCGGADVSSVVKDFISAYNQGDQARLDALFATSGFGWYSTDGPGARFDAEARDRTSLLSYFADRRRHREQLTLRAFQFNGVSGSNGNFQYKLSQRPTHSRR